MALGIGVNTAIVGALGLVLAVIGVYGIVSFAVSGRTQEIGIRMALGAEARDILKLVARQGLQLVIVGLGVGLLSAWALSRAMASLLDPGAPGTPRRPDGRFAV